jgi:hypothetical protein
MLGLFDRPVDEQTVGAPAIPGLTESLTDLRGRSLAPEPTSSTVLTTFQLRRLAYWRVAFTCKGSAC